MENKTPTEIIDFLGFDPRKLDVENNIDHKKICYRGDTQKQLEEDIIEYNGEDFLILVWDEHKLVFNKLDSQFQWGDSYGWYDVCPIYTGKYTKERPEINDYIYTLDDLMVDMTKLNIDKEWIDHIINLIDGCTLDTYNDIF